MVAQVARVTARIAANPYIPHRPTVKQAAFLALDCREALYGGAAGGGKSDALLMAALIYVDVPGYAGILFRRTFADLALPDAIMSRSHEWLQGSDARWHEQTKTWHFPSGATLSFGYLQHERDKFRYQSAAFQFIGWDELTQFRDDPYLYLFSRLRRLEGSRVPLRVRAASNPGGEGHAWVYSRFLVGSRHAPHRAFVPAGLEDNPHIDRAAYLESLSELDPTTRLQLEQGVWVTDPGGKPFKREWWRGRNRYHLDDAAIRNRAVGRYLSFDTAIKDTDTSAWTAWCVFDVLPDYRVVLRAAGRERLQVPELPDRIARLAHRHNRDEKLKAVVIEDEASGSGAIQTLQAASNEELARRIVPYRPRGSKLERWRQAAVWASRGGVMLPHPGEPWLAEFEAELFEVPDAQYKDQADAFAQGILYLEHYLAAWWHAQQKGASDGE